MLGVPTFNLGKFVVIEFIIENYVTVLASSMTVSDEKKETVLSDSMSVGKSLKSMTFKSNGDLK
jgi:hypothetical protein